MDGRRGTAGFVPSIVSRPPSAFLKKVGEDSRAGGSFPQKRFSAILYLCHIYHILSFITKRKSMRLLIFILAVCCGFGCGFRKAKGPPPSPEDFVNVSSCTFYQDFTVAQRRKREPWRNARKVELVSFASEYDEMTPDSVVYKERRMSIPKRGKKIDRTEFKEVVALVPWQKDSLTSIFFNHNFGRAEHGMGSSASFACFYPRHALLFYRESTDTDPFAYFEICLECHHVYTFPSKYELGTFCEGKYDLLREFFRLVGIRYGLEGK